jgi:2-keto-3-deoxy-L-rhamnonate aldolase RhmA
MTGLRGDKFKEIIKSGRPVLGAWLQITDPIVSRSFSKIGFDFLLIDWEHAAINIESLQDILYGFENSVTCPLVRLPKNDPLWTKWALDLGAEGVVVPNIQTAEEAKLAVDSCKYPPKGIRGWGPKIPSNFYLDINTYNIEANERIVVILQIEHVRGVENLDEILKVPDIDCIFIGPGDLSASLNILGQWNNPILFDNIKTIINKTKTAGLPVAMAVDKAAPDVLKWISEGVQIVTLGFDWTFMQDRAIENLKSVKQGLK